MGTPKKHGKVGHVYSKHQFGGFNDLEKNGDDLEDSCLVSFHVYFVSLDDTL